MTEQPSRGWEELARAARVEQDPKKLLDLVEELNRALEERITPPPPEGDSNRSLSTHASVSRTASSLAVF
ncbi:MAG TPA: hypothetical protein VH437_12310 [Terriglobales bacterium]|jgi:hypothetical protein